jgi:hypothetical protein
MIKKRTNVLQMQTLIHMRWQKLKFTKRFLSCNCRLFLRIINALDKRSDIFHLKKRLHPSLANLAKICFIDFAETLAANSNYSLANFHSCSSIGWSQFLLLFPSPPPFFSLLEPFVVVVDSDSCSLLTFFMAEHRFMNVRL